MSAAVEKEEVVESPDVHFQPLVSLPLVETKSLEDEEEEYFRIRAKLFRFDTALEVPEWKERGVGDMRIMKNPKHSSYRVVMRRDKTHKICANHMITPDIKLLPSAGSDRAWVYNVLADYADEEPKREQLAIRFKNAENAQKFKEAIENCQAAIGEKKSSQDELATGLEKLSVKEENGCATESGSNGGGGDENSEAPPEETKSPSPKEDSGNSDSKRDPGSSSQQDENASNNTTD